jgi:hypothetical protein
VSGLTGSKGHDRFLVLFPLQKNLNTFFNKMKDGLLTKFLKTITPNFLVYFGGKPLESRFFHCPLKAGFSKIK